MVGVLVLSPWGSVFVFKMCLFSVTLLQLYCLDANAVAQEVGLGRRVNMVMQAAFFALSGVVDMEEVGFGCGCLGTVLQFL